MSLSILVDRKPEYICIQTIFFSGSPAKLVVNKANYTGLQIANNKSFDLSKYLMYGLDRWGLRLSQPYWLWVESVLWPVSTSRPVGWLSSSQFQCLLCLFLLLFFHSLAYCGVYLWSNSFRSSHPLFHAAMIYLFFAHNGKTIFK